MLNADYGRVDSRFSNILSPTNSETNSDKSLFNEIAATEEFDCDIHIRNASKLEKLLIIYYLQRQRNRCHWFASQPLKKN